MGKVYHASYSGYFPYCLSEQDISSYSYVANIPLALAMATFWRAKRIRWFGTINWPSVGWDNLPWHIEISSGASTESNLVCQPFWYVTSVENLNDGGGSPIVVGSQALWNSSQFYYERGTNKQNLFSFDIGVDGFFVAGAILGFTLVSARPNPILQTYSMDFADAGTLVLAGEFPYSNEDPGPPNDYTTTLNHEIEYWSYGETYNTATGLPL